MYPNPQDALPLPARPDLEQYRKLAKDLVKACQSANPLDIGAWAMRWVRSLAESHAEPGAFRGHDDAASRAGRVAQFAQQKMREDAAAPCRLTSAQFVIARAHGFLSWPKFVKHIGELTLENSEISAFEAAALAVVEGDTATLKRLLRDHPGLAHARSTREHRATLLHYVSANGVEHYRQVSTKNAAEVTELLMAAGAEVDARSDVYGGGCTALGLVATSVHPQAAGVQNDVIDVLLRHGARMDLPGSTGGKHSLIRGCLANGQPQAADYLASRGAPLDLEGAAGTGRVEIVKRLLDEAGGLDPNSPEVSEAFGFACVYGQNAVVELFLERGMPVDAELKVHGSGHTGLHPAAYNAHVAVVETLLRHGAKIDAIDKTWGTPPLCWAMAGWVDKEAPSERYYQVVARLVAAGAPVRLDLPNWEKTKADPKMQAALRGEWIPLT